jgi:hypothetical protein
VWFICGYLFHVLTVIVLLSKNADDIRAARGEEPTGSGEKWVIRILILALLATALVAAWRYYSI